MSQFLEAVSASAIGSLDMEQDDVNKNELHLIIVCDRAVGGTLGLFYHYSLEYWRTDVASVPLNVESDVSDFRSQHDGAKRVEAVELLRESGWRVYEFKDHWVRDDGWEEVGVAVSVIHRSASGANVMPIFSGDEATVLAKWKEAVAAGKEYGFGEQHGFDGGFQMWPNSVYYIGDDVNNSNTFVRTLVRAIGLTMNEMSGSHPGRMTPSPIVARYSKCPWRNGTTAPPEPQG